MAARTSESVSTCFVDFSILVMPPRNPNDDADDEEEDEDGEAESDEDEPAVIREPGEWGNPTGSATTARTATP
jgi:hypothetical protein